MRSLVWYFDFISPFAFLQWRRLGELPGEARVTLRPVLFAGLLEHSGGLGPAEIPAKRAFTYRYVQWVAEREGIALRWPEAHPFNPLPALRLAVALDARRDAVGRIFEYLWCESGALEGEAFEALARSLGVDDVARAVGAPEVKARLRANTEEAIASGVFGVPTFVDGELLFWGVDATEMVLDHLHDPQRFSSGEYARIARLPVGVSRRR